MLRPERRRRGDLVAAAALALGLLLVAGLVIATSDGIHAVSVPVPPGTPPPAALAVPGRVPDTLVEAWRAPSAATDTPVHVGATVVTADDHTVTGRDPLTGRARWSYRRNLPLCAVVAAWDGVLAAYRNDRYCSEVSSLLGDTGQRGPTRNSDIPVGSRMIFDGTLVTASGARHLEAWRSDLVKTTQYGRLRSPPQPFLQPRPACLHTSLAVGGGRDGLIERCADEPGDRLTVLMPDSTSDEHPDVDLTTLLPVHGTRVVALTSDRVAVALPDPPRLSVRGPDGAEEASYPLDLPPSDLAGDPVGTVVATTSVPGAVLWWTGSRTVALDQETLRPLWTVPGALGPGTLLADAPVVPVPGAVLEIDPSDGRVVRTVPVDRGPYRGPVTLAAIGPVLLEQRGTTVVALH